MIKLALLGLAAVVVTSTPMRAGTPPATAEATPAAPFTRQHESEDGHVLSLQMTVREYRRDNDDRSVYLAGAIHVGDKAFYEGLQQRLDGMDAVLFEGVQPPGAGRPEFDLALENDEAKSASTKRRVRYLATAAEAFRNSHNRVPKTLDELAASGSDRLKEFVKANLKDSWGHELVYALKDPPTDDGAANGGGYEITSLGSDGLPGGEGTAADIRMSDLPPLKKSEVPKGPETKGLQQQLASALGLVFQLDVMNHNRSNWRSSDLSVDQIEERMGKAGANADELFRMLDGTSFQAGVAKLVLGLIKLFPSAQVYGKIVLIEAMARADELMAIAPGGLGASMDVIIKDRNAVVLGDLKKALDTEPGLKKIAIIYGAGHMADMEAGLAKLGFHRADEQWADAISIDLKSAGMDPMDAKSLRDTIRKTLDAQVKAANKKAKPAKP